MSTTRIVPRSFRVRSFSATTFSCSGPRTPRTTNCRGPNGIVMPPLLARVSIRTCPLVRNTRICAVARRHCRLTPSAGSHKHPSSAQGRTSSPSVGHQHPAKMHHPHPHRAARDVCGRRSHTGQHRGKHSEVGTRRHAITHYEPHVLRMYVAALRNCGTFQQAHQRVAVLIRSIREETTARCWARFGVRKSLQQR